MWLMDKKDLNRRAAIVALADPEGDLPGELDTFDPISNRDDLVRLLISTQISFTRCAAGVTAEGPFNEAVTEAVNGSEVDAAALAAVRLAASWAPSPR
jgi:hypothetical protein